MWLLLALFSGLTACGKLNLGGGGPGPSPSSSPTTQPSPGVCETPDAYNPKLVVVAMGNAIAPVSVQKYGTINGYSLANLSTGQFSSVAQLINTTLPSGGVPITSKNVIQFTNVESGSSATINHSAVGFKGDAFPKEPYAFPSPAASPVGTTISNTQLWSTGRISPSTTQQCYSREFTLKAGTYYFGDYDYYNLSGFRDVLIVGTPQPQDIHRKVSR
jgi:hypothetical protein